MSFNFIRDHAGQWPIRLMCRVLKVSANGYYAWRCRPESARSVANRKLLGDVRRLHGEHHGCYCSPRMHAALRAEGRTASRGRIERLMRRHGIRALAGRRFRPCTTDSRHNLPVAPSILKQEFVAEAPNRVWRLADLPTSRQSTQVIGGRRKPIDSYAAVTTHFRPFSAARRHLESRHPFIVGLRLWLRSGSATAEPLTPPELRGH